jgi:hypothetical protein
MRQPCIDPSSDGRFRVHARDRWLSTVYGPLKVSLSGSSWTVASTKTVATVFPSSWRSSAANLTVAVSSPVIAHDPQPVPTRSRSPLVAWLGTG